MDKMAIISMKLKIYPTFTSIVLSISLLVVICQSLFTIMVHFV